MNIKKTLAGFLLAAFTTAVGLSASAQTSMAPPAFDTPPAATQLEQATYLGYIHTSSALGNDESRAGLQALSEALAMRTVIVPQGVVALDPDQDDLSFYHFLYWAVPTDTDSLSSAAQQKIQKYLDSGGVILFDVSDQDSATGRSDSLQKLLQGIHIKPLAAVDPSHTLTKTFYLLAKPSDAGNGPRLWVENPASLSGETVSSIIVSDTDWAGAWAGITVPQDSREREMALRTGINMVMYALTGRYKDDLVHVPEILERMNR